jgi:hypothetical protein
VTRIFIAIAAAALAFVPSAHATQWPTVEADNGAIFQIARVLPTGFGSVQVLIIPAGAHGDLVRPVQIQFDCHGHIRNYGGALEYVPPRSVAGRIADIACGANRG